MVVSHTEIMLFVLVSTEIIMCIRLIIETFSYICITTTLIQFNNHEITAIIIVISMHFQHVSGADCT